MDRLATILANLRRRDNIRDFIDGLEDRVLAVSRRRISPHRSYT
jgi:hypothetical protein